MSDTAGITPREPWPLSEKERVSEGWSLSSLLWLPACMCVCVKSCSSHNIITTSIPCETWARAGAVLPALVEHFRWWQQCYCCGLVWLQGLSHAVFALWNLLSITLDSEGTKNNNGVFLKYPSCKTDKTNSATVAHFHLWAHLGPYNRLIKWSRHLGVSYIWISVF